MKRTSLYLELDSSPPRGRSWEHAGRRIRFTGPWPRWFGATDCAGSESAFGDLTPQALEELRHTRA